MPRYVGGIFITAIFLFLFLFWGRARGVSFSLWSLVGWWLAWLVEWILGSGSWDIWMGRGVEILAGWLAGWLWL